MYTILMNTDKSLVTTVRTKLHQGENLVDKIQFLCPEFYGDLSLKDCKVILKYIDQGNVPHCEILSVNKELYKDKVRCVLPVDTDLTRFAGAILVSLTFEHEDVETQVKRVLHSGEIKITIEPRNIAFQTCIGSNNNNNNNDDSNDSGNNSTDEEEFPAVEF